MSEGRYPYPGGYSGDYLKDNFDESKQYLGELKQQNSGIYNVDENDAWKIMLTRLKRATKDLLGSGFIGDAFKIEAIAKSQKDNCDATTNWAADSGTVTADTGEKQEGTASLQLTGQSANAILTKTLASSEDWYDWSGMSLYTFADVASDALKFFISDGTNTSYWDLSTDGTSSTWKEHQIDLNNPDSTSGTAANLSLIATFGFSSLTSGVVYHFDDIQMIPYNEFTLKGGTGEIDVMQNIASWAADFGTVSVDRTNHHIGVGCIKLTGHGSTAKVTKTISSQDWSNYDTLSVFHKESTASLALKFFISDGTNTSYWDLSGTTSGDVWLFEKVDLSNPDSTSGSPASLSAITSYGFSDLVTGSTFYFDSIRKYNWMDSALRGYLNGIMMTIPRTTQYLQSNLNVNDGKGTASTAITSPTGARTDWIYLDVWLKEQTGADDAYLIPASLVSSVANKLRLILDVKVLENSATFTTVDYVDSDEIPHLVVALAKITRTNGENVIITSDITDQRDTVGLFIEALYHRNVIFEGTVANGDVVYYDEGNTRFDKAVADGTDKERVIGIADVTNSRVWISGYNNSLLSGLTAGADYYLSVVTAGAVTTIITSMLLGTAKTATGLFLISRQGDAHTVDGIHAIDLSSWVEVAPQLGGETYIYDLVVFNNKIYGGTYPNGKLYEWNGTNAWVEVAPQLGDEVGIHFLVVFNNKIYGGTSFNGKLYEWNGTNAWVEVAPQLGSETYIYDLVVFNNKIYGCTGSNGKLYEWNGTNAWVEVAPQLGGETRIYDLVVFNNKIYGGTYSNGKLYEWNGTNAWVEVAPQLGGETYIYDLVVFNNKIYGCTRPNGKLYEYNGTNAWVEVAPQLGSETIIYSLVVFNNKIYGGTYSNGKLYEWNGTNAWVEVAPQLGDEVGIHFLVVFNNKIYGGTSPNGKLYEWHEGNANNLEPNKLIALDTESKIPEIALRQSTFGVHKNGVDQTNVGTAMELVTWAFEIFDTHDEFSSSRFTPANLGKYKLKAVLKFNIVSDGDVLRIAIYKNGNVSKAFDLVAKGTFPQSIPISSIEHATVIGDYFEIWAANTTGADTVDGTYTDSYFQGCRVGPDNM